MEQKLRIKALRAQRDAIGTLIESCKIFLINYDKQTDAAQLQIRVQKLNITIEKLDPICDELDVLDERDKDKRIKLLEAYDFDTQTR